MTEDDRKEVKAMIDEGIAKHNREAAIISAILGSFVLGFYADGLFRIVENLK